MNDVIGFGADDGLYRSWQALRWRGDWFNVLAEMFNLHRWTSGVRALWCVCKPNIGGASTVWRGLVQLFGARKLGSVSAMTGMNWPNPVSYWRDEMNLMRMLALGCVLFSQVALADTLPQRWVSAGGSLSEWIVALGGEGRLVGVDSTSLYPHSLQTLPSIGYQRALSAEGILALQADILVGSEEMGPPPVLSQLAAAGVRVERLSATADLASMTANVERLGQWLGADDRAQALLDDYRQALAQRAEWVKQVQAQEAPPRVLMLLGHGGGNLLVAGKDTQALWLIEHAGGQSPVVHQGYKPMSSEALLALDPQVLIFADRSLQGAAAREALLQQNPLLRQTKAGREGRLLALDASLLVGGLGPRVPQSLAQLSAVFYPHLHDGGR